MANSLIKQITLPSGTTYDICDADARSRISSLESYTDYLGVTTTALTDGATTNPITINNESVTAKTGNIVNYNNGGSAKEFIFNGTVWQEFGDLSALGTMAYVNSAEAAYTPAGTVSAPDITVTPTTQNVIGSADAGTLPACTMPTFTVVDEVLSFTAGSFNAGTLPSFTEQAVVTGATAALDSAPTFTGTSATITSTPVSGS